MNRFVSLPAAAGRPQLGRSSPGPDREALLQHPHPLSGASQEIERDLQSLPARQRGSRVGKLDQDQGAACPDPGTEACQ